MWTCFKLMHSLLADLSPLICCRTTLLSWRFEDYWPWWGKDQTFSEDKTWGHSKIAPTDASSSVQGRVERWLTAWAPASPAPHPLPMPSPLKASSFYRGNMAFETSVHHLPRWSAAWIKQTFISYLHLSLEYWLSSGEQLNLSLELVPCLVIMWMG